MNRDQTSFSTHCESMMETKVYIQRPNKQRSRTPLRTPNSEHLCQQKKKWSLKVLIIAQVMRTQRKLKPECNPSVITCSDSNLSCPMFCHVREQYVHRSINSLMEHPSGKTKHSRDNQLSADLSIPCLPVPEASVVLILSFWGFSSP